MGEGEGGIDTCLLLLLLLLLMQLRKLLMSAVSSNEHLDNLQVTQMLAVREKTLALILPATSSYRQRHSSSVEDGWPR